MYDLHEDINSRIWLNLGNLGNKESMLPYVNPLINALKFKSNLKEFNNSIINKIFKVIDNFKSSAISEPAVNILEECIINKFNFRQRLLNELYSEDNQPYR